MLTKEGLLSLLDRMKEAVERGSDFALLRYEAHGDEYIVHARIDSLNDDTIGLETTIAAV